VHEVSLSRQLAAAVVRAAAGRRVDAVHVVVGQLRQVVPAALHHAWAFVVRGTVLDAAVLHLDHVPAVLTCDDCGSSTRLGPELGFDCRGCGSRHTHLTGGEEFVLASIDVHDADPTPRGPLHGTLPSP
jgi:hydrogenase nickel incorporation protein HypA/HybF